MNKPHNPGPWVAEQFSGTLPRVRMATGGLVAIVHYYPDAQLIAAAPEMLAALHVAHKLLTGLLTDSQLDHVHADGTTARQEYVRIAEAIEEATGERIPG